MTDTDYEPCQKVTVVKQLLENKMEMKVEMGTKWGNEMSEGAVRQGKEKGEKTVAGKGSGGRGHSERVLQLAEFLAA